MKFPHYPCGIMQLWLYDECVTRDEYVSRTWRLRGQHILTIRANMWHSRDVRDMNSPHRCDLAYYTVPANLWATHNMWAVLWDLACDSLEIIHVITVKYQLFFAWNLSCITVCYVKMQQRDPLPGIRTERFKPKLKIIY